MEGLQDLGRGRDHVRDVGDRRPGRDRHAVDLDAIPRREPGLEPFEVMISESQERMCAAVRPERWDEVREVCTRWGLPVAVIGRVTEGGDIVVVEGGLRPAGRPQPGARELARIPARALTSDAIVHTRLAAPPTHRRAAPAPGAPLEAVDRLPERGMDPGAVLLALLGSANLASRHAVFHQYDSTVGADTVAGPDAVRPCCGSRARARRSWPRPTGTRASASPIRGLAPRSRSPRPRATCRSRARGPWA